MTPARTACAKLWDLATIVGLWNRMTDEMERRIIEVVRANLPTESSKTTSNSER